MMKISLLVCFSVIILPNIEGSSYGENLLTRLSSDVNHMKELIGKIQQYYRNGQHRNSRYFIPLKNLVGHRNDHDTDLDDHEIGETDFSFEGRAPDLNVLTRRSNDPEWKNDFYTALSHVLKDELESNDNKISTVPGLITTPPHFPGRRQQFDD